MAAAPGKLLAPVSAALLLARAALLCGVVFAAAAAAAEPAPPDFSLAASYDPEEESHSLDEYWMSEKYDGVRALWDGARLISRGGNVYQAPRWFTDGLPPEQLDGELWLGRGRFEETVSIVRRAAPHDGWRAARYMVFDLPSHGGDFRARYAALQRLRTDSDNPYWQVAEQRPISSAAHLQQTFDDIIAAGGEGLMLRRIASRHRGGRSDDLLKYKPFADAEAVVIAHNPGKGKYAGLTGSLRARMPDGAEFNVGSGLSDAERRNPPPIGSVITYQYQGLTGGGKPRFPVFLRVRDDEPAAR